MILHHFIKRFSAIHATDIGLGPGMVEFFLTLRLLRWFSLLLTRMFFVTPAEILWICSIKAFICFWNSFTTDWILKQSFFLHSWGNESTAVLVRIFRHLIEDYFLKRFSKAIWSEISVEFSSICSKFHLFFFFLIMPHYIGTFYMD